MHKLTIYDPSRRLWTVYQLWSAILTDFPFPLGTLLYFESKVISWAKPHEITHNFSDESEDEQCQSVGY